jgi:recombinational DNA repair ATPase RecF
MDLKYVHIAGYKNLVDSTLAFDMRKTTITIISNNGSGKSNLIEALLHIFVGLYYDNPPEFDFFIRYQTHNKTVEVENRQQAGN